MPKKKLDKYDVELGRNIRKLRRMRECTVTDLAKHLKVSSTMVHHIEAARRNGRKYAHSIAHFFQVSINSILPN
jgi:DNA-binding XRE family transcriptional regulator